MDIRYFILLFNMFIRTDTIQLKIGVIITSEPITEQLTHNHICVHGQINITTEIIWKRVRNYSLFNIAQTGSSMKDDGLVSIFAVGDFSNNLAAVDWIIPLSGIGHLRGENETDTSELCPSIVADTVSSFQEYPHVMVGSSNLYYTIYSGILMSVLNKLTRRYAILVYSEETEFIIRGIYEKLHTDNIFLSMYKIDETYDNEKIYQFLQHVYHSAAIEMSIIVVCGSKLMKRLMNEANYFDDKTIRRTALSYKSRWLMFHIDEDPLDDATFLSNLNNVAILHLPKSRVKLDLPPYMTLQYLLDNFVCGFVSLKDYLPTDCLNETFLHNMHKEMEDFIVQTRKTYAESKRFPIKTLMFHKSGRQWSTVGNIALNGDIEVKSVIFPNVEHGFNGKKFTVSTLEYHPFEYTINGTWKGLCIDLLNELSRQLNFTYDVIEPEDGEWGVLTNGLSWTGLIGQLQKREVDMTVAPLSIQESREKVMDFTMAFFFDISVILMKKPDPRETQWKRLIEPLRWEVMVLAGCLVPIVSVILFSMERVNPFYKTKFARISLHDTFWYAYGCVFMQGGLRLPASQTGRTIVCCWWLFCIILSATYSGNLIAFLTVTKEKPPFDSLSEMVAQNEYEWGTLGGTYWMTWFEYSAIPVIQSVWYGILTFNKTDPRVLSKRTSEHITKVKEGKYAYIAEKSLLEIMASKDCELHIAKEEFLPLQYGIGLPNDSPYTKLFSDSILNIHETGLMQIWKQQQWPKQNFCAGSLIKEAKPIKWIDIQTAFYLIGIGTVFGVFILCSELIFNKCRGKKTRTCNSSFCNKVAE